MKEIAKKCNSCWKFFLMNYKCPNTVYDTCVEHEKEGLFAELFRMNPFDESVYCKKQCIRLTLQWKKNKESREERQRRVVVGEIEESFIQVDISQQDEANKAIEKPFKMDNVIPLRSYSTSGFEYLYYLSENVESRERILEMINSHENWVKFVMWIKGVKTEKIRAENKKGLVLKAVFMRKWMHITCCAISHTKEKVPSMLRS